MRLFPFSAECGHSERNGYYRFCSEKEGRNIQAAIRTTEEVLFHESSGENTAGFPAWRAQKEEEKGRIEMNVTYCKGIPEDEQAIVDFADLVFSKSHGPHDFRRQLPNLYGEGKKTQQYHYRVKEDGVIRGMVCVVPMEYRVGSELLKVNGVGSVSVHSSCKGK